MKPGSRLSFPDGINSETVMLYPTMGRIASYKKDAIKDGKLLSGSLTTGYRTLNLHRPGNKGTLYIHREMAKLFLKKGGAKYKVCDA